MSSPVVPITLDKPRTLVCDYDACDSMESALNGVPLLDIVNRLRGASVPTLTIALWACLRHEDKTLTMALTKKIVKEALKGGSTFTDLSVPVIEAITRSGLFGEPDEPGNETAAKDKE